MGCIQVPLWKWRLGKRGCFAWDHTAQGAEPSTHSLPLTRAAHGDAHWAELWPEAVWEQMV